MSYKIAIVPESGKACPVIVCDHCQKRVEHHKDGNALWLESKTAHDEVRYYDIVHTHKKCHSAYKRTNPAEQDQRWMSHELRDDLQMTMVNMGLEGKTVQSPLYVG